MTNVIPFERVVSRSPAIDVSALITRPMPEIYGLVMSAELTASARQGVATTLRFVARSLIGGATGAEGRRPEAFGLTVNAALRRACDLLDLADELEKSGSPAPGGTA